MNPADSTSDLYCRTNGPCGYSPGGTGGVNATGYNDPYASNPANLTTDVPCGAQTAGGCPTAGYTIKYATGYQAGNAYTLTFTSQSGIHSGGANYLLADGHVKWLTINKVSPATLTTVLATAEMEHHPLRIRLAVW